MADDQLKNLVLQRAEDDEALGDDAKLVVMAALESDDDLADVLAAGETAVERVASLNARIDDSAAPAGAYLRSISVQGFRGIGARVKVDIPPGPGLIVIAGRNGSGKSSIAEALELALTGVNSRWTDKATVWTRSWRNLHAKVPAEVRIGITEEGSGVTTLGVDWPAGDVPVAEHTIWVQREGKKQEPPSVLGWSAALDLYRPLLSYDELGTILEGRPVDFYDQLFKLLGLEQLTSAIARLDAEVGRLKQPAAAFSTAKAAAKSVLTGIDDPRAAPAIQEVGRHWPRIETVRAYVSGAAADAVPQAWRQAEMLGTYTVDGLTDRLDELRAAAAAESAERERADALVADRVALLERAVEFHGRHGDTACPVCSKGTLDEAWVSASREVIEAGRASTAALVGARGRLAAARAAVRRIVTDAPPVVHHDALTTAAAEEVLQEWQAVPVDGDLALADHVERAFPKLQRAYQEVADEASRLIRDRSDAWAPAVEVLVEWLRAAEAFVATDAARVVALVAQKWLKDHAHQLRNERLAPLAEKVAGDLGGAPAGEQRRTQRDPVGRPGQSPKGVAGGVGGRRRDRGVRGDESGRAACVGAGDLPAAGHRCRQPVPLHRPRRSDPGHGSVEDRRLPRRDDADREGAASHRPDARQPAAGSDPAELDERPHRGGHQIDELDGVGGRVGPSGLADAR